MPGLLCRGPSSTPASPHGVRGAKANNGGLGAAGFGTTFVELEALASLGGSSTLSWARSIGLGRLGACRAIGSSRFTGAASGVGFGFGFAHVNVKGPSDT